MNEVTVTVCPDGPLLLRGTHALRTADGQIVPHQRSVLALCRCGRSALKPLCDGSHKASRFRDPADAETLAATLRTARPPARRDLDDHSTELRDPATSGTEAGPPTDPEL